MDKLNNFLKKYAIIVIGILLFLLMLKSCQSCTRKNTMEYNQVLWESQIDSMQHVTDTILLENSQLKDSIRSLKSDIKHLNTLVEELKNDKSYLKSTNIKLNNNINKVLDNR